MHIRLRNENNTTIHFLSEESSGLPRCAFLSSSKKGTEETRDEIDIRVHKHATIRGRPRTEEEESQRIGEREREKWIRKRKKRIREREVDRIGDGEDRRER